MIRKFKYGYLLNNKAYRVFNIYTGASGECGGPNNAVFRKENPLLAPDILSWWEDE